MFLEVMLIVGLVIMLARINLYFFLMELVYEVFEDLWS
jgi:hypothetical protein